MDCGEKAQKGSEAETPPKKRYHALRLVMEAERIGTGLGPRVWFDSGPDRDAIMRFRNGEGTQEEFLAVYTATAERAKALGHKLSASTNVDELEPLLVDLRREFLSPPSDGKAFDAAVGPTSGDAEIRDRYVVVVFLLWASLMGFQGAGFVSQRRSERRSSALCGSIGSQFIRARVSARRRQHRRVCCSSSQCFGLCSQSSGASRRGRIEANHCVVQERHSWSRRNVSVLSFFKKGIQEKE